MFSDKALRGEKVPSIKLAVVQYGILVLMLALAAGLVAAAGAGRENFKLLAEQNRIRKVPMLAPRGKLFDRENRLIVDNYPSVSCFLVREQNHNVDADLPLIAHGLHLDLDQLQGHAAPLSRMPPAISRFPSRTTSRRMSRLSSKPTATSCLNWRPSKRSGGSIRATDLRRT